MKTANIKDFVGGWIIGNFSPSLLKTHHFEVAFQNHYKGDLPTPHYHKESTEFNIIIKGSLSIDGKIFNKGDIFIYEPYEISNVKFLEDTSLVVIRNNSNPKDKYLP